MRRLLTTVLLAAACTPVLAGSFAGTTAGSSAGASSNGTSASSGSSSGDDKIVLAARDDAALFVASDGRIRGVRLEAALHLLRENDAVSRQASDLALAKAILAR
ncbi:hypothetical protein CSC70_12885 [Pseudoxanthomonas kalamensis DSM 18571]|uniref:DUF2388 domain-containing protein n=1 Tax=Pseudoxanthomonas kalamensis TaxID=289483 RepID=UPI00139132CB|nr:DUF2388 domain-containing protein [Pseudoxanthomonas kalamensis]KAF1708537.1 hypothetical protein CSC70_12885 [Pseudoxanthomonas kalamensis DSM 18571]